MECAQDVVQSQLSVKELAEQEIRNVRMVDAGVAQAP